MLADDIQNEVEIKRFFFCFCFERVEHIMENGQNANYRHFLLFPQCVHGFFSLEVVKSREYVVNGTHFDAPLILILTHQQQTAF